MGFFSSLAKAAFDTALLPIAVAKDVATMGGSLTDKDETYTGKKLKDVDEDLEDASDSLKD